jgi:hypothetical protein
METPIRDKRSGGADGLGETASPRSSRAPKRSDRWWSWTWSWASWLWPTVITPATATTAAKTTTFCSYRGIRGGKRGARTRGRSRI